MGKKRDSRRSEWTTTIAGTGGEDLETIYQLVDIVTVLYGVVD